MSNRENLIEKYELNKGHLLNPMVLDGQKLPFDKLGFLIQILASNIWYRNDNRDQAFQDMDIDRESSLNSLISLISSIADISVLTAQRDQGDSTVSLLGAIIGSAHNMNIGSHELKNGKRLYKGDKCRELVIQLLNTVISKYKDKSLLSDDAIDFGNGGGYLNIFDYCIY